MLKCFPCVIWDNWGRGRGINLSGAIYQITATEQPNPWFRELLSSLLILYWVHWTCCICPVQVLKNQYSLWAIPHKHTLRSSEECLLPSITPAWRDLIAAAISEISRARASLETFNIWMYLMLLIGLSLMETTKLSFAAVVRHDIHGNKNTEWKQVQPTKGKVEPFTKQIVSNTGRHKKHVRGTSLPCVENVFL